MIKCYVWTSGHNKLKELPEDFGNLKNLEWDGEPSSINVDNNPLLRPPLNICLKGIDAIRNYFEIKQKGFKWYSLF